MRRNSLLILLSMIVLLVVIGVLLFFILSQSLTRDRVATDTAAPATLPVPPDQQNALSSEPDGTPIRLVYIVSILIVFVSAVLLLFRMLLNSVIKDRQ